MKTELRTEVIIHPEIGPMTKVNEYTWDETRFPTLDEAIAYTNPNDPMEVGYLNRTFVERIS